jgi:hypothetical protein
MAYPNHNEAQARTAFQAHVEAIFFNAIRGAHQDYQSGYSPQQRLIHSKRTRATILYDHARARLDVGLAGVSGVHVLTYRGLTMVILDDQFLIKIPKKLSRRFLSRTYPTEQTLAFMTHTSQESFPFLHNRTSVIVGYLSNDIDAEAVEIWATCPDGSGRNHWKFQLQPAAGHGVGTIGPSTSLPPSPFSDADANEQGG